MSTPDRLAAVRALAAQFALQAAPAQRRGRPAAAAAGGAVALTEGELVAQGLVVNTEATYLASLRHFERTYGGTLPAAVGDIKRYLTQYQTLQRSTHEVRLWAIARWHKERDLADPTQDRRIQQMLKTIATKHGHAPDKATPLVLEDLTRTVLALDQAIAGAAGVADAKRSRTVALRALRDKALLLMGFWCGFRSEELAGLQLCDIRRADLPTVRRLTVFVRRSKGDRRGTGRSWTLTALPTLCPVAAYWDWVDAAFLDPEADAQVFRAIHRGGTVSNEGLNPGSLTKLLRRTLLRCGLEGDRYSSHSLRRGLATSWYALGGSLDALTHWVGWADPRTALGYQDEVRSLPEELQRIQRAAANQSMRSEADVLLIQSTG